MRRRESPWSVAVALDPEPSVSMAAVARVPYGIEESAFVGGLHGKTIEAVKCEAVDIEVPANSQIIIEGKIPPGEREMEGPFGEFSDFMGLGGMRPFANAKAVTFRSQPIYHTFIEQMPPSEGSAIKDVALEVTLLRAFRAPGIPGINGFYVTEAGDQYHVVVSMKKLYPGHVKRLFRACWSTYPVGCKQIMIADEDCNIY
jgi:2,5-furandicarboxylate decarboxylase 1